MGRVHNGASRLVGVLLQGFLWRYAVLQCMVVGRWCCSRLAGV
jgi:hypothetical protein